MGTHLEREIAVVLRPWHDRPEPELTMTHLLRVSSGLTLMTGRRCGPWAGEFGAMTACALMIVVVLAGAGEPEIVRVPFPPRTSRDVSRREPSCGSCRPRQFDSLVAGAKQDWPGNEPLDPRA